MYNKGINKYLNDNFEVKNREIFIKVKKDNKVKYICTSVNTCIKCNLPYINNKRAKKLSNYLNEYSFDIKELQINIEESNDESKEEITSERIKEYENIISSFRVSKHLEFIRELEQSSLRINEQKKKVNTNDLGNNLNEESELKKLGYSSSLSRVERWNILKNKAIPKLGKVKVESHIRWLIKMNINRANRSNAVNEWQHDLEKLLKMK